VGVGPTLLISTSVEIRLADRRSRRCERGRPDLITLTARAPFPDDVWARATEQFEPAELAQLVFAITAINAWNRLVLTSGAEPGHYQPQAQAQVAA
jgi:hypothetical protein